MSIRITLAAGLVGLATSCNLQLPSPSTWGEGNPPELIRFTGMCLGGGTTNDCTGRTGEGQIVRFEHTALQTIDWVMWDPVGRQWGLFDVEQQGWWFNSALYPDAPTHPEGENAVEVYARPHGRTTGPWVLHRRTFYKRLDPATGRPVFDFNGEVTRQWVAEADLPFKPVTLPDGRLRYVGKEVTIPLYPPYSYCLAPGAAWPVKIKPYEAFDDPPITTPALYTYFQPAGSKPKAVIYRNGEQIVWLQSFLNYHPTAIPSSSEARYVIYAIQLNPLQAGSRRWWRIWTPSGPLRLDLVEGRPQCQNLATGYGWEKTAEGVYRSGEWRAEMMPEGFVFPGYDPEQLISPPDQLPPELDPWR